MDDEMKYVVSWTFRSFGSVAENEAAAKRIDEVYSKWTPPAGTTFHQFLVKADSSGGYGVIETDNPADLAETTAKFGVFAEYRIDPVLDAAEAVALAQAAIEFRESIG
jgi:hypothetical protein